MYHENMKIQNINFKNLFLYIKFLISYKTKNLHRTNTYTR